MAKLTREEAKIMGRNISEKTVLKGAAWLSTLTKVVHNPVFLAYLTNRPDEIFNEYRHATTGKNKATLPENFIPRL